MTAPIVLAAAVVLSPAPALLHVDSEPTGSGVWIDDAYAGRTPLEVTLAPGEHTVAWGPLESASWLPPAARRIRLSPGGEARVTFDAAAGVSETPASVPAPPDASPAPAAPGRWARWRASRWWRPVTLLVGVGGAGAAVALKQEADASFDAYLDAGDPARQKQWFARAEAYDRGAIAAWVAAGAGWSGFVTSLLRDPPPEVVPWPEP